MYTNDDTNSLSIYTVKQKPFILQLKKCIITNSRTTCPLTTHLFKLFIDQQRNTFLCNVKHQLHTMSDFVPNTLRKMHFHLKLTKILKKFTPLLN